MPYYETVFMARQDLTDAQVQKLTDTYSKVITDDGGKIHKTEYWGLRTLAYKINKAKRAHYILIESDTASPAILEMERQMRIDEDVVRYLTIRQEELSTELSVMMKPNSDSDDKPRYKKEAA